MKNLFKAFVPVAAAAIALVSCQQDIEKVQVPGEVTIRVHATADNLNAGDPETKTYIDTYQGTANTILWGTGEYMKLAVTPEGGTPVWGDSTDASADLFDGEPQALFEFSVSPAGAAPYLYQGLYPASAAVASNNTNPANYKVNLPATQNATASSYDPAAYIMVAKPKTFDVVETDWTAKFRRATALNKITLKNVPDGISIKRVEITAPSGKYLAGGRHINLTTTDDPATQEDEVLGDFYSGGGRTETVEVKFETPLTGTDVDVWFCSWGVEVAAGETLTIKAFTTDKKSYTKSIEVPSGKSIKFQEGYLNTLGANMSGIAPEDVHELEEGSFLVLANNNGTYYALKAEAEGTRMNYESYIGSTSAYVGSDASIIWNISRSGSSYIFANGSNYLGWTSGNTAAINEPGESWTTDNYLLDATYDSTNSCYTVSAHKDSNRILAKNTGSYGFAFYTGSGYNQIIFVPATLDTRTAVSLTFDNDQVDLTSAEAANYLGEDLTVSPDVAAVKEHLVWSYEDNDGIIDEFDNGALTLTGDEGSATVTVSFAGDENYQPASASYTITVAAASAAEPEWVETAIGDLTSSDVFVMVANGSYAISSAGGSSSNPPAVAVTVSGTKLTGEIADAIKWNISGNSTDGFTFYPDGETTKLFCNTNASSSSNTNLRVGNGGSYNRYLFVLDSDHLKTNDDYTARYIGINGTSDFRGYTSSTTNPCTFKFYKYVAAQDNRQDAGMSWSSDSATATYSTGNTLGFTAPTLTPGNATGITYESTDETIATISNAGVVSINLTDNSVKEGSTTIKAVFAGDTNYKPQTVSYTLTVVDNRARVATPTFSPVAGEVSENTDVTISSTTESAYIYYTTDGTTPTTSSNIGPVVTITSSVTIKAIATKTGYKDSEVATAAYTVGATASTVAQVLAGGAATDIMMNNLLVYDVKGKSAIVGDATGKMLLFMNNSLTAGDNISITSGATTDYQGILEITAATITTNSQGNTVDHGTPINLNDASAASATYTVFSATGYHFAVYISMTGEQSGRYITGSQENTKLYLNNADPTNDGKTVNVTGYIYCWNSSFSNYNFQCVSIAEDSTAPFLSVNPASLSWAADEIDSKSFTVTLNGAAAAGDYTYNVTSGKAGDWTISKNNGTLTVAPNAANTDTENAKSITIRIAHDSDDNVCQDVTCTQAKASSGSGNTTHYYVKVTTTSDITNGDYLIVYENGNVAFDGGLSSFDAVGNTISVTIGANGIESTSTVDAAKFTISSMTGGYSIQGASGKYITVNSYNNGLATSSTAAANGITIDSNGDANITVSTSGGTMTLKFNSASNQNRFRYYKTGQQSIQLYKLN